MTISWNVFGNSSQGIFLTRSDKLLWVVRNSFVPQQWLSAMNFASFGTSSIKRTLSCRVDPTNSNRFGIAIATCWQAGWVVTQSFIHCLAFENSASDEASSSMISAEPRPSSRPGLSNSSASRLAQRRIGVKIRDRSPRRR
jgi:hypothetical protein